MALAAVHGNGEFFGDRLEVIHFALPVTRDSLHARVELVQA